MDKAEPDKPSLEEVLGRFWPFFLLIMIVPLVGMLVAITVLVMLQPPNLPWLVGLLVFFMAQYVATTYLVTKKMIQLSQKRRRELEAGAEEGPKV